MNDGLGTASGSPVRSDEQPSVFIGCPQCGETRSLAEYLACKGFLVRVFEESRAITDEVLTNLPDVVLLSSDLPPAGGFEVCQAVRDFCDGLIFIQGTARDETAQLLAFERGADDYFILPASPVLLATRIQSRLKRLQGWNGAMLERQVKIGDLVIDATRREVLMHGQPVDLTSTQFDLLWYLARRAGHVISREQLYEAHYQVAYNGLDRSVDIQISRIRQQLGDNSDNPTYLKTIRGVGYQLVGHE